MQASVTTMVFGPLAIQVARMKLPDTAPRARTITADVRPGPWDQTTIRVWPNGPEPVSWPPSVGLHGEAGIDALSKRWSPNVVSSQPQTPSNQALHLTARYAAPR